MDVITKIWISTDVSYIKGMDVIPEVCMLYFKYGILYQIYGCHIYIPIRHIQTDGWLMYSVSSA